MVYKKLTYPFLVYYYRLLVVCVQFLKELAGARFCRTSWRIDERLRHGLPVS